MDRNESFGIAMPIAHLPRGEEFLLWPPCLQSYGYRIVDQLFATRRIQRSSNPRPLARGRECQLHFESPAAASVADLMDQNNVAGLIASVNGEVVLERYGLGLKESDCWSTMSTVKSMTALLVGAAIHDRSIGSLDDTIVSYLPNLRGTAYTDVTIRHLLTMSSGVGWNEDYEDRNSHVNRYSRSLANKVPGGVLQLMASIAPARPAGTFWNYNTGDTYLLGAVVRAATERRLADYMAERVWEPAGMEFDAFYTLESTEGQEIAGSRAGMSLRDMARLGMLVMNDGQVAGRSLFPEGWIDTVGRRAFRVVGMTNAGGTEKLGVTDYGMGWWLDNDGGMWALGHCGQCIYVHRQERITVVQLAVYPEPPYERADDPDRQANLLGFIAAIRRQAA